MKFGAAEEVAPNAYFDADEYYAAKAKQYYEEELKQEFTGSEEQIARVKAKIKDAGMNAWTHYQQFGSAEGVNPSNAFDASDYCAAKAEAMNAAGQKAPDGTDWTAEKIAKAIDDAGMSVLEHYLTYAGTGKGEVAAGSTFPVSDDPVVPSGETIVIDDDDSTIAYTGSAGDDKFYLKDATTELHAYNTLDGGEGNDTLILDNKGLGGATIRNIENLVVRNGDHKTYDLSAFSTSFTLEAGTDVTVGNVTDQKLVFSGTSSDAPGATTHLTVNMAAGQASVDLASQNRAAGSDHSFELKGDSLTSVKLAVDEGAAQVNFEHSTTKVTDLAITATVSEAKNDKAEVNATDLTNLANVTVAGAGAVELTVNAANKALKTVNAADNTGGVTVNLSEADNAAFTGGASADTLTVDGSTVAHTLGAGDDTVVVKDTADNLAKGFSVDGGKGTDTLAMSADLATSFTSADAVAAVATNFEILQLTGNSAATDVNMNYFGGIDRVVVGKDSNSSWSGKLTLTDMANDGTLEYAAAPNTTGVEVTIKNADEGKTDVLNVTIAGDKDVNAATLTVADVETINITADDTKLGEGETPVSHSMILTAGAATAVNISGDAALNLTLTNSNKITKIDASGNTGGLAVDLTVSGINVTGSSAADEITLGFNNTVNGMGGNDTFTVTAAVEEAGKVDVDRSYSTIQEFAAGDKLDIDGVTTVVNAGDISGNSLADAVTAAMTKFDSTATTAVSFMWGNDTYVVMDAGTSANNIFDKGDFLVKLAGVTGVDFEVDGDNLVIAS